jgi:hypothetical protein
LLLPKEVPSAAAMLFKVIQNGSWLLSSLLLLATAAQLWRTGHHARLTTFFWYLLLVGTHGLINFVLSFIDPLWWFYSFFVGSFATTILGFVVLYEVARNSIHIPVFKLNPQLFLTLCAVGAALAVLVSVQTEVTGAFFIRVRILLEISLRVMQVSILCIFAFVSLFFGLLWRRLEFGVVLGYGIYAASQLLVMWLRASGTSSHVWTLIPLISYCCSATIWLVYSTIAASDIQADVESLETNVQASRAALERLR